MEREKGKIKQGPKPQRSWIYVCTSRDGFTEIHSIDQSKRQTTIIRVQTHFLPALSHMVHASLCLGLSLVIKRGNYHVECFFWQLGANLHQLPVRTSAYTSMDKQEERACSATRWTQLPLQQYIKWLAKSGPDPPCDDTRATL